MAVFRGSYSENRAIGQFQEKECGKYFEYRLSDGTAPIQGSYGLDHGFKHEIAMCDGSVRFANVKKTVAYVVVNEDDFGMPIVEKWQIKQIWQK
jgi:hypothetical protein